MTRSVKVAISIAAALLGPIAYSAFAEKHYNPVTIAKKQRAKLLQAEHDTATPTRKKQLDDALVIFNALKFRVRAARCPEIRADQTFTPDGKF